MQSLAMMLTILLPNILINTGNHIVSDIEIRAFCPISGSNDCHERHEMRLILLAMSTPICGINERFNSSVFACQKQTLTVSLIITLFHHCFIYFIYFLWFSVYICIDIFCNVMHYIYYLIVYTKFVLTKSI